MPHIFALLWILLLTACAAPKQIMDPQLEPVAPVMPLPSETFEGKPQPRPASLPSYRGQAETRARTAESYSGPAVLSLLKQSRTALSKGRNDQASAALERALRIEPKNPFVWQALASVHLDGKRAEQAEATAEKAISLSQNNPHVAAGSWALIAQARTMLGDVAGAEAAQQKADELKDAQ
ncbi:MAG: tetratricopeptide repeat protein [Pseudomonadota bacterium]